VNLTLAEERAVALVADGESDKSAGRKLGKSYITVRDQVKSARRKLGAKTRAHLVKLWIKAQI